MGARGEGGKVDSPLVAALETAGSQMWPDKLHILVADLRECTT